MSVCWVWVCWGACSSIVRLYCVRLAATRVRPHRVPADHTTSEVLVRALHSRVDDVHAHAAARQVAIIVDAVDRGACAARERATRVRGRPRGKADQGAVVVSCARLCVLGCARSCGGS